MAFSGKTRGRAWMATIQKANLKKVGIDEDSFEKNPELVAKTFCSLWAESGTNRVSAIVICKSAQGHYHAHMALYGNTTTLSNVAKILMGAHVEPQLGGKKELKAYLLKEPPYDEKGEEILYSYGLENIKDSQGKRSDIEEIEELIQKGYTPRQIMEQSFSFVRFERMIKIAYLNKRLRDTPLIKETHNEYHFGASGTGKTHTYISLCEQMGEENIYMMTDTENGGLDKYLDLGAPPILFIDEFKGSMKYSVLLTMLDKYSRSQAHCRFFNTYMLWKTCIITSIYPIEKIYSFLVDEENQKTDSFKQLIRRFTTIHYHYIEDGEYKTFVLPASEYISSEDMIAKAQSKEHDGFLDITKDEQLSLPFDI